MLAALPSSRTQLQAQSADPSVYGSLVLPNVDATGHNGLPDTPFSEGRPVGVERSPREKTA
jgi:hypothetical protein